MNLLCKKEILSAPMSIHFKNTHHPANSIIESRFKGISLLEITLIFPNK
jgi:hypothetical protein